ncbi:ABC transporter permease [Rhodoferax fermentans]|uniref:Spermidine/putrescine ABC transporter permease n=1 Tax=Rhodoferax fermentans TaxID=28066 RepID=A0A1T1AQ47_RHOFE|nr:ABC transporter permease subunit [Rhodoferax fermentans]MBK1685460.1 spermidine/putrescine ABC transporter permease [Rhodoferax fermentans]OOV06214.1 spermidine/putrescine ABC transporter permease [Rhodoferax fermentans]
MTLTHFRFPAFLGTVLRGLLIGLLAVAIFGPLLNMLIWTVTEAWYYPAKLPVRWGFAFWDKVFRPEAGAMRALSTSLVIALLTVVLSLAVAIPAGYALSKRHLPLRSLFLLFFLLPQAFPTVAVHLNIARMFYGLGLTGTIWGVMLVHAIQGLVLAIWIASAAFAAIGQEQVEAARNLGASPLRAFMTVSLPLAAPGLMASAIFVFLISLDEFSGTFFVGVPNIQTLPLTMLNAAMEGNYQIASITALLLLVPSTLFMLFVERFLKADVLASVGK